MKRFTDAGREAVKQGNLYCAVSMALMMPDICASLEDPGPGKSRQRYVAWFKKWGEPKFTAVYPRFGAKVFLSAEDCYQLRCSLIHSGSAEIDKDKQDVLSRFEIFESGAPHLTFVSGMVINGVKRPGFLQLDAAKFSDTMYTCADEWDAATAGNNAIQAEKKKLLLIRSKGTVIDGIAFGSG